MAGLSRVLSSLRAQLLLAHFVVILVGVNALLFTTTLTVPTFAEHHFAAMRHMQSVSPGPGSAGPPVGGMGGMMGTRMAELAQAEAAVYQQALVEGLAVAAAAALIAAVLVSVVVSGQVVTRVGRLGAASQRIASGEYAERVPTSGADEIDRLAQSFNAMAAALEGAERRRQELIGDVAHELRTPLATLQGYLEGLLDGVVPPSEVTWAKLQSEVRRLRRLVEDLQELSRAEARQLPLSLRPLAPATLVQTAVERLGADFKAQGLELRTTISPGLPNVVADADRAAQVITNLLTNALRYTPAPGQVDVSVEPRGNVVRFAVRDSGVGLAPEHLSQVFERFYRVDKSRARALGGAGVGLTISKALVEAMGGRIWAESSGAGQGTTFTFELPLLSKS